MINGFIVHSRDITDQKEHREKLERQNERLERFSSVVSHDLRNPLNVAVGQLDLLKHRCDCSVNEEFDKVGESLDRIEEIITDLLTVARQGTDIDQKAPVTLSFLTNNAQNNVDLQQTGIRLIDDCEFLADRSRAQQLFENLFRNAVEHTPPDTTITIGTLKSTHTPGFFIKDDGPGIPPDSRDEIFELGYSTETSGTGFGLAIVNEIATAHGWTTAVTESAAGGARFEFHDIDLTD